MNRFVTTLLIVTNLIRCSESTKPFCEVKAFDNVFSVGYDVHFYRCGQVWNHDPRLYNQAGGIIIDYSWYSFARRLLYEREGHIYNESNFRFAAFSFHEAKCLNWWVDLERECVYSAQSWNGLSFIVTEKTVYTFKYDTNNDFNLRDKYSGEDMDNPFSIRTFQYIWYREKNIFWPDFTKIAPQFKSDEYDLYIYSGVYDIKDLRLYLVLLAPDKKHYCLTHLNMRRFLFDVRMWPSRLLPNETGYFDWAPAFCFIGHMVGMFLKEDRPYLAGQVRSSNGYYFEDEVYSLNAADGSSAEVITQFIEGTEIPHNLRTFFGCRPPIVDSIETVPGYVDRKKRSIKENKPMFDLNWKDITAEVKEDAIQLSVLSFVALSLIFIIFRLFKH